MAKSLAAVSVEKNLRRLDSAESSSMADSLFDTARKRSELWLLTRFREFCESNSLKIWGKLERIVLSGGKPLTL